MMEIVDMNYFYNSAPCYMSAYSNWYGMLTCFNNFIIPRKYDIDWYGSLIGDSFAEIDLKYNKIVFDKFNYILRPYVAS